MDILDIIFNAYVNEEISGLQMLCDDGYIAIPGNTDLENKVTTAIADAEQYGLINGLKAGLMLLGNILGGRE